MVIEGDIIVPEDFYARSTDATYNTNLWPNGLVPYAFDPNVSSTNQGNMRDAMDEWEAVATINFEPWNGAVNFIWIRDSSSDPNPSNSSPVGMQGGAQIINITSWNSTFIMAHELAHSLGMWHEQSRLDRDNYVQINWQNIQQGRENNFDIQPFAGIYPKEAYGLPDAQTYDFDSVMHYWQFAFSANGQPTITVLPPNNTTWQTGVGQRTYLSDLDQLTMSFLYPAGNWTFLDQTHTGPQTGTFFEPYFEYDFAVAQTPVGGYLWIQPGAYVAAGIYDKPMILDAPLGNVTLSP